MTSSASPILFNTSARPPHTNSCQYVTHLCNRGCDSISPAAHCRVAQLLHFRSGRDAAFALP